MGSRKTKALTYYPTDGGIRISDVPVPRMEADEVLVRITLVAFTRRDHLVLKGAGATLPEGSDFIIPGHIAVGKVIEKGELVKDLVPGDTVVPTIRRDCDRCIDARSDMCAHPDRYRDSGLSGAHGFARELAVIKARYLVPVPEELEDIAPLLTPLSVAEKAHTETVQVIRRFNFYCYHDAEETIPRALVTGMGPLGMMLTYLLSLYNYRLTIFCRRESDDTRSRIFRDMDLEYINTSRVPLERLAKGGYAFRQLFETTGDPAYTLRTMPFMAPNAVMVLMGLPETTGEDQTLNIPAADIFRRMVMGNQVLVGSIKAGRDAFDSAVKHLQEIEYLHGNSLREILSDRYPFDQYHKLLTLQSRESILPILELG